MEGPWCGREARRFRVEQFKRFAQRRAVLTALSKAASREREAQRKALLRAAERHRHRRCPFLRRDGNAARANAPVRRCRYFFAGAAALVGCAAGAGAESSAAQLRIVSFFSVT
jgi:hypothetical protein